MPITSEIITVTPEDARRFLANMVHNRPLSQANVKVYAADIAEGRWGLNGQGIIFDPRGRLLDGQHRMHAVIKTGKSIKTLAVHGVPPEMFSRMDIGNKRTVSDVIDVKNRVAVAAVAKYLYREAIGSPWWNSNVRLRPAQGVDVVRAHPGSVGSVGAITGMGGVKKLMTTSNAGYCHYRAGMENEQIRDVFFNSFNSGADLGPRSPVLALRTALLPAAGMRVTDIHQISLFICAWGMFVAGSQCKFIRLPKDNPVWAVPL